MKTRGFSTPDLVRSTLHEFLAKAKPLVDAGEARRAPLMRILRLSDSVKLLIKKYQ